MKVCALSKKLKTAGMCSILFLMLVSLTVKAAEVQYPVQAYTAEELAQLREWEKKWVGQKIDKSNIDQVAAFMPQSYVELYKNPAKWGAGPEGLYFYIVPYKQIIETPGMIEATKKYAPLVKTNSDGTIANYAELAGVPYPDPKSGQEVAWNFDFSNHGDSNHYMRSAPNVNPKNRTDRLAEQEQYEFWFIHRTELDPKPALPDNPKGIHRGTFLHMWDPPEFINTRYFNLRYVNPKKDDDTYLWYSQFRRIRRLSTTQRTDSVDGTDLIYDDEFFWDGHITRNTYEYKGKKELLCCRHQDMSKVVRPTGQLFGSNLSLERCKTLVVSVVNKDPNYIYGRRVWYLDPETYIILWTEIYDENDRFWKCFMNMTQDIQTAKGVSKNFIVGTAFADFQRVHGGQSTQEIYGISLDTVDRSIFSISHLQKTY